MIFPLFFFRTDIGQGEWKGDGLTPLHVANWENREEIAVFLINTERDRVRHEREGRCRQGGGARGKLPSYNMKNSFGRRPMFFTSSVRIMEEFITLHDLEVTVGNGMPLLWQCALKGTVSKSVATDGRLATQYSLRYEGTLPLEIGETTMGVV